MDILRITLFGCMQVSHSDSNNEIILSREIQLLLAFLLLQRHRVHPRDVLASIFWGEQNQEKARGSLSTALWKLKKALEPNGVSPGTYLRITHQGEIGFNTESPHWLDIDVFERTASNIVTQPVQAMEDKDLIELEKVLMLYKGELLDGSYKDWVLRERERLRALYLKSLTYLLQYYGFHGVYERAISYGQQILDLNPLSEEIHREMMRFHMQNGQRTFAIQQYEICRSTLAKELGISPMDETQILYKQIFNGAGMNGSSMISKDQSMIDQATYQLREAHRVLGLVNERLQQALELIQQNRIV